MTLTPDTQTATREVSAVEIATVISPEAQVAGVRALLQGSTEVIQVLCDRIAETRALITKLAAAAGKKVRFLEGNAEDVVDVELTDANEERELSPEIAERTLSTLETRFSANNRLHEGCDWNKVKSALEANPEALWSISQMEAQGHMPNVYDFDESGFDIGTSSEETPAGARNCVYDAEAAEWLKANYPNETFNGNAVEMAEAMGIKLMAKSQYETLQSKGKFDEQTWSWLLTDEATRKAGRALRGGRVDVRVRVWPYDAHFLNDVRAWRGSLRVLWA